MRSLTTGADAICVEVTDDGIGMSTDGVTARGSTRLGLIGMRERVMAMAGSLVIKPGRNGKGLSLVARLPCEHPQHADVAE